MPSSLNLCPTSVWFMPETENSLQYFKQGKLRNLYLLLSVLFDFELHLEKVVERGYAAIIRKFSFHTKSCEHNAMLMIQFQLS